MDQLINSPVRASAIAALLALCVLGSYGCSVLPHAKRQYTTVAADPSRDEARAIAETKRAARLVRREKWDKAEEALQDALLADVAYGPAHNNLGNVYLRQGKLYLAAWEFEYAAKLMPERPEPNYNLGMVYEQAEQLDQAIDYYSKACQMAPRNPQFIGNLARALLKRSDVAPEAPPLLSDLILYDTRPEWVCWARQRLALGKFPQPGSATPGTSPVTPPTVPPFSPSVPTPGATGGVEILPPGEIITTDSPDQQNPGTRINIAP
jgi:Tfp pilus assembly protein PilF